MSGTALRVDRIELRTVALPLVQPFRTSFGEEPERLTVIVTVTGGGLDGYGESPVARTPGYSYETAGTAFHVLRDVFAPRTAGQDLDGPGALGRLFKGLKGHPMARAGLETALWDLWARRDGRPVAALYGGARDEIEVGVSVGIQDSVPALVKQVGAYLDEGYRRVKIKIRPGWDVEPARAVRRAFPALRLWADANQAYERSDADRLRALDDLGLELLEQPLHEDDLLGHARWAEILKTPLCLDESVRNRPRLVDAAALGACTILNLKPARVGGPAAALEIEAACAERGIAVWCGGLLETGIGRLHNVALASRKGYGLPGDLSASNRYFHRDLVDPPVTLTARGTIRVPTGPGLGAEVDLEALDAATVRRAAVTA